MALSAGDAWRAGSLGLPLLVHRIAARHDQRAHMVIDDLRPTVCGEAVVSERRAPHGPFWSACSWPIGACLVGVGPQPRCCVHLHVPR